MNRGQMYAQAIRGPVVLMTVGVLFAIHQAGGFSFSRTWPLIIIVIGLVKLLERVLTTSTTNPGAPPNTWQQRPPYPPYPPQGGTRL